MNMNSLKSLLFLSLLLSGCGTFYPSGKGDVVVSRAQTLETTSTHTDLISLPNPRGKVVAAVYHFRDKTGQYRQSPSNGLSTAVTQGADTILMKALLDSNWFIPVERVGLQNLLTERKISQSASAGRKTAAELPAVTPAQIILQGTVVSYDSNTHTGGTGARLLGIGASQSFREDRVTVNLRLIDIDDGHVLHSVSSSKRIFSRQLNSGVFSYIDVDKILELEAGSSYNEPAHIAITEAIESALIHVIGEGVIRNTWQLTDETKIEDPVFDRFLPKSQRDEFLSKVLANTNRIKERNLLMGKVRNRVFRAQKAVKEHWESLAQEREQRRLEYAKANRIKLKQEALLAASNPQPSNPANKLVASTRPSASAAKLPQKVQRMNNVASAEQLIANQAKSILNAQANIQIQATKQAHQAALYAQKLLLQKQAQQKQQAMQNESKRKLGNTEKANSDTPLLELQRKEDGQNQQSNSTTQKRQDQTDGSGSTETGDD